MQAGQLGLMLFEKNEELEARLLEASAECERLQAIVVDTSTELTAARDAKLQLMQAVDELQHDNFRCVRVYVCVTVTESLSH